MKLPPQTNVSNVKQSASSNSARASGNQSKSMPQNHRVGGFTSGKNTPSEGGAPMPLNHGYGKRVFSSTAKSNKFASGGKKPPGCC